MKVFLSWSGERSRYLAEALRMWLPRVIQPIKPWMSDVDIPAGARWQTDIAHELDAADFGIICVTPENMDKPWLMFEAGALSKSMKASRVCPLVYSMELSQLGGPIAQFQANKLDREGIFQILKAINAAMPERGLDAAHLSEQFEMLWGRMEQNLKSIPEYKAPSADGSPKQAFSSYNTEEVMEFLRQIVPSSKHGPIKVNEPAATYTPEKFMMAYAPVSTLEGALSGLAVVPGPNRSLGEIVAAVDLDLNQWDVSALPVPTVFIDLSEEKGLTREHIEILRPLGKKYPFSVEIDIGESQLMSDSEQVTSLIHELTAAGLYVGIKEFGTGYSSLSVLQKFSIRTIWIARTFVCNVVNSETDGQVITAMVALGERLGLNVIADGVANPLVSKALLKLGVKNISGTMAGDVMSSSDVDARISA